MKQHCNSVLPCLVMRNDVKIFCGDSASSKRKMDARAIKQ